MATGRALAQSTGCHAGIRAFWNTSPGQQDRFENHRAAQMFCFSMLEPRKRPERMGGQRRRTGSLDRPTVKTKRADSNEIERKTREKRHQEKLRAQACCTLVPFVVAEALQTLYISMKGGTHHRRNFHKKCTCSSNAKPRRSLRP